MALVVNTISYKQDRVLPDAITYVAPTHSFSQSNKIEYKRVYPKAGGDGFAGVARPLVRVTRSVVINATTGERKDAILTIGGSLPVGMTDADIATLLADAASLAGHAATAELFKKLDVNAEA